ncbi:MAG: prolipoprotein diacylglyceryl transferase [Puniceicoccales bacterium]|jgi:phosphatidylglycerol:prolipoprotein diacylglycerol transferase|nr:prolipoprotein diacylglyceryl transferase [Puniceicoccales bacterium]
MFALTSSVPPPLETTSVPTPGFWVHNLDPLLVRFPEGFWLEGLRWYGLAYVAGFVMAGILLHSYRKRGRISLNSDQISTLLTAIVLGVLVGGRLGYVFGYMLPQNPRLLLDEPLSIFRVDKGGMASHGGMIGVWIALAWFARRTKTRFWNLMDISATLAPAGLFFGRIANFINGELWGRETDVAWAVIFRPSYSSNIYLLPRHPSQLYEAGLEGLLLLVWTQWRFRKGRLPEGRLAGETMLGYAIVRVFCEIFREPDAGVSLVLGLSRGQFYSLFLGIFGMAIIIWATRKNRGIGDDGVETPKNA